MYWTILTCSLRWRMSNHTPNLHPALKRPPHLLSLINLISFTSVFMLVVGEICENTETSNDSARMRGRDLHLLDRYGARAAHHAQAQVVIISSTPARKRQTGVVHSAVHCSARSLAQHERRRTGSTYTIATFTVFSKQRGDDFTDRAFKSKCNRNTRSLRHLAELL